MKNQLVEIGSYDLGAIRRSGWTREDCGRVARGVSPENSPRMDQELCQYSATQYLIIGSF